MQTGVYQWSHLEFKAVKKNGFVSTHKIQLHVFLFWHWRTDQAPEHLDATLEQTFPLYTLKKWIYFNI